MAQGSVRRRLHEEEAEAFTDGELRALEFMCRGASWVLFDYLRSNHPLSHRTHVPVIWDERDMPLCAIGAPVVSFPWDGSIRDVPLPTLTDVSTVVCMIVDRLCMHASDVVVALVLLQSVCEKHGPVTNRFSLRPILLAACIVALKLTHDSDVSTSGCVEALSEDFTALGTLHAARIEHQLLECLNWEGPSDTDPYRELALALLEWGTPANAPALLPEDVPWL